MDYTSVRMILIHYFLVNLGSRKPRCYDGPKGKGVLNSRCWLNVGVACGQESVDQGVPEGSRLCFC